MAEGTNEKIVDRVRKLLELAGSSNVHEAANAAAAAQELMTRYAIDSTILASEAPGDAEQDEGIEQALFHRHAASKLPTWKASLATTIANVNGCKAYSHGADLRVAGRPSDAARARTLFSHVATEIDRLALTAAREYGHPGRTWINNFRIGAVVEIKRKLNEAHVKAQKDVRHEAQASGNGHALARVNNALARIEARRNDVQRYADQKLNLRKASASRTNYDAEARHEGARAAAQIDLSGRARLEQGVRGALK